MTLDQALSEWRAKPELHNIGCVAAAAWWTKRVAGFKPVRLTRAAGNTLWEHVVITDGTVFIDPSPWNDHPTEEVLYMRRDSS